MLTVLIKDPERVKSVQAHILHLPENHVLVQKHVADEIDYQGKQVAQSVEQGVFLLMGDQ